VIRKRIGPPGCLSGRLHPYAGMAADACASSMRASHRPCLVCGNVFGPTLQLDKCKQMAMHSDPAILDQRSKEISTENKLSQRQLALTGRSTPLRGTFLCDVGLFDRKAHHRLGVEAANRRLRSVGLCLRTLFGQKMQAEC
jgi:hypothetical protein